MQITGFETTTIEAKRFSKSGEHFPNVRIDHSNTITQITKSSENGATVEFRFTINYTSMGYIKMEGAINLEGEVGPLLSEWATSGSMPNDTVNMVHNAVVSNCMPTAILVARDIRLPLPIPLPRMNIEKKTGPPVRQASPEIV